MDQLISGATHDPHALLGAHPADSSTTIRTMRRGAGDVALLVGDERHPMKRVHDVGVFEAQVEGTCSTTGSRSTAPRTTTRTAICRRSASSTCT